jgi:hypothetical protein
LTSLDQLTGEHLFAWPVSRVFERPLWDFRRRVRDVELRHLYFGTGHFQRRLSSA